MLNSQVISILFLLIIVFFSSSSQKIQKGGSNNLDQPFSNYQENSISQGNPLSYAGRPNCKGENRLARPTYRQKPQVTFWGHGIPLVRETKLPQLERQSQAEKELRESTLSGRNILCSPSCCPSPYSCDGGCLCYSRDVSCFRYDGQWKD